MIEALKHFPPRNLVLRAVIFSLFLVVLSYPKFIFFKSTPMEQINWELQDPGTSHMVFAPSHKIFLYELFNHHQILWSNGQGLGLPVMGQGIQGAPFFPLSMALSWIPERWYWNTFVVCRLFLTTLACLLISFTLFNFGWVGAITFTLALGYSLVLLRFLNHPYLNGVTAGLWEIFFLAKLLAQSRPWVTRQRLKYILALVITFYSVLTSGFPEAILLMGILSLLIFLPYFWLTCQDRKLALFVDIFAAHAIGFCLACPQLFALFEFVAQTGKNYRVNTGLHQIPLRAWLEYITRFANDPNKTAAINSTGLDIPNIFNLCPLLLFGLGFSGSLKKFKTAEWGALLCFAFGVCKIYPLWPWFNKIIGNAPILKDCWFPVYFMPLIVWGFAAFAARGAEKYLSETPPDSKKAAHILAAAVALLTVVAAFSVEQVLGGRLIPSLVLFAIFYFTLISRHKNRGALAILALVILFSESYLSRPKKFPDLKSDFYHQLMTRDSEAARDLLTRKQISPLDFREISQPGSYVDSGIGTIDMGNSAVIPERLLALRTTLFEAKWDGYQPFTGVKTPYSYDIIGAGLESVPVADQERLITLRHTADVHELGTVDQNTWFKKDGSLSRAYVAATCAAVSGLGPAKELLGDPKKFRKGMAILESLSPDETALCHAYKNTLVNIPVLHDEGSKLELTSVQGPAILVLNDNVYPGWTARDIDTGGELEIKHVNLAFRGLILPAHRSYKVRFTYSPPWLKKSLSLVLFGLLSVVSLLLGFYFSGKSGASARLS